MSGLGAAAAGAADVVAESGARAGAIHVPASRESKDPLLRIGGIHHGHWISRPTMRAILQQWEQW
jgi:hypothetical protein